jgi:uncharacterized membrane protein YbhN (UPF0104 family)
LWLLQSHPEVFRRFVRGCFRFIRRPALGEKVQDLSISLAEGLSAIGSLDRMLVLVAATAVVWALEAAFIWAMAAAVGVPLSIAGGALVAAVLGLGLMIPAAPGYVGTYEFFAVAVLSLFGASRESALALTLVMHAWVLLFTTGMGLAALAASGVRLSRLLALPSSSASTLRETETDGT